MKTIRFVLPSLLLALAACGLDDPPPVEHAPTCSPQNCAGCCDDGVCRAGTDANTCGTGGASCTQCIGGEDCRAGLCKPSATTCGPGNCSGCCDGNVCKPGSASNACGTGGQACSPCAGGNSCENGSCQTIGELCSLSCEGCCSGNTCNSGNTALACGRYGSSCSTCETNEICDDLGWCAPNCALTCSGCCVGNTCMPGYADAACGKAGASCQACGTQDLCNAARACEFEGLGLDAECSSASCRADLVCSQDSQLSESRCRTPCPLGWECGTGENCVQLAPEELVCVRAPVANSSWKLYVGRVRAATTNGGQTWDPGAGAPDLRVCFDVPGKAQVCTPTADDTFEHDFKWMSSTTYTHADLSAVVISVWDVDFSSHDLALKTNGVDLRSPWAGHAWYRSFSNDNILELRVGVVP